MNDYRPAAFTPTQLKTLMAPLDPKRVSNRKQGGSTLSYVEAHDIKAMLIRIFGFGNFSSELVEGKILKLEEIAVQDSKWENGKKVLLTNPDGSAKTKMQWRAVAQATVKLTIHQSGAVYTEAAISSQNGIDPGEVADFAIKTAESDAFKRCSIFLGTQFGLSLYANGQTTDTVQIVFEPRQHQTLYGPPAGTNPQTGEVAPTPPAAPAQPAADAASIARMQGALSQPKA